MNLVKGVINKGTFTSEGLKVSNIATSVSGPVTLGFRAEDARMVSKGGDIAAPVYSMELLGDATMATTRIDGALVAVKAGKDFRIRIGDTMQATIASELCHLFDAQSGVRLDG